MAKAIADRVLGPGLAHKVGAALQDLATRHALHHHPDEPSQSINVMDLPKANHDGTVLNNVVDGPGAPAHHASGGYDHAAALPGASFTGTHHNAPETSAAADPDHTEAPNHTGAGSLVLGDGAVAGLDGGGHAAAAGTLSGF